MLRNSPAQGDSPSPEQEHCLIELYTGDQHGYIVLLFMFYFCGTEAMKRSLALGKYYLRGKQQKSAEDEFAGTTAQMMFFDV